MESSRANSGQSAPLMAQDLQPSTVVGFQQQGTVDWTRIMSGSVTFSVDVLSRLSKAGVEAFTIYAARAIFSNVKLGPNGELRLHRALDKLSAFPSFGKALWFGFGVKHIIWSMQESTEGLNCLGICACLTEGYSTIVAAKTIRELFLLYNPPAELTPALRQWLALVESSAGLLASSEFGLVLHGLTRLCLRDGLYNLQYSGSPKDIALVLKQVFEISTGRLDRLFLSGGADCAWIAAVAHWLLDLRVEVQDQDGTIIYRPDGTRSSAARIFLASVRDGEGHKEFSRTRSWRNAPLPISESSYGRGFCLLALRLLPELNQNPVLHQTMEAAVNTGYLDAAQQFSQSFTSLRQLCSCIKCRPVAYDEGHDTTFCLLLLIQTICTLVRGMSVICMQQDLEVRPTRSGLESLYWDQGYVVPDLDPVVHGLLKSWPACGSLMLAQMLFSGQQQVRVLGRESIAATSHSGLCFCLNTLMEITSDPQRACVVTVVPGKIEWNNFMYNMVSDHISGVTGTLEVTGYDAVSMTSVTKYDDLADSSSPGLNAELIIEEVFPESTSLSAIYRVSTAVFPSRHFPIGPSAIWHKLGDAYTAASCEGKTCDSLNGYQSILVKGEGLLLRTPDWQRTRLPITRVLSAKDVSVWVALSQTGLWTKDASMNDISISVIHRLQGKQCTNVTTVLYRLLRQYRGWNSEDMNSTVGIDELDETQNKTPVTEKRFVQLGPSGMETRLL
ncbi:hypothetical protein RAB80_011461 [Fusarium oxysporum f. sp. vasinfectum]|nr:hypothetical protein RAB80_011461 [Fusarium oxysporum f. sp. vasinfectum]